MILAVADVVPAAEALDIAARLAALPDEDGRATAGWNAKLVKANRQTKRIAEADALRARLGEAILRHPVFQAAVRPKALTRLILARYGAGHAYGTHVDDALMQGMRTDVSFTLFLADPAAYGGGELTIESAAGEEAFKLAPGSLLAYPSTALHRVEPVTRGERAVAVGWARSYVRDAARRELLFDLDGVRRRLFERDGKTPEFDLLSKSGANLLRMWAED